METADNSSLTSTKSMMRLTVISGGHFSSMILISITIPFLPQILQLHGASNLLIGVMYGGFSLLQAAASLAVGRHVIRSSDAACHIYTCGCVTAASASLLFGYLDTNTAWSKTFLATVLALRLVQSVGTALTVTAAYTLAVHSHRAQHANGVMESACGLASALGPFLGGWLYETYNFHVPYYLIASLFSINVVLFQIFVRIRNKTSNQPDILIHQNSNSAQKQNTTAINCNTAKLKSSKNNTSTTSESMECTYNNTNRDTDANYSAVETNTKVITTVHPDRRDVKQVNINKQKTRLVLICITVVIMLFNWSCVASFIHVYLAETVHFTATDTGVLFLCSNILYAVTSVLCSRTMEQHSAGPSDQQVEDRQCANMQAQTGVCLVLLAPALLLVNIETIAGFAGIKLHPGPVITSIVCAGFTLKEILVCGAILPTLPLILRVGMGTVYTHAVDGTGKSEETRLSQEATLTSMWYAARCTSEVIGPLWAGLVTDMFGFPVTLNLLAAINCLTGCTIIVCLLVRKHCTHN